MPPQSHPELVSGSLHIKVLQGGYGLNILFYFDYGRDAETSSA